MTEPQARRRTAAKAARAKPSLVEAGAALSAVPSTLRIPLAARALGDALFPRMAVHDAHAARLLAALGDDGRVWLRDRGTVFGILARTRRLRAMATEFLAWHPEGHVVNLGCGLAHYFQWLDNGQARMTDADLPEVLAIRRQLLPPQNPRHELRTLDLTDEGWWDALGLPARPEGPPVCLLCEGVLMYLSPATVRAVLRCFGERAPAGSRFGFDAMSWLAVGRARINPSVRRTAAEFRWGPRRLAELTAPSPRLRLSARHSVMDDYGWPATWMGTTFQAWFGLPMYAVYELQTQDGASGGAPPVRQAP